MGIGSDLILPDDWLLPVPRVNQTAVQAYWEGISVVSTRLQPGLLVPAEKDAELQSRRASNC